MDLNRQYGSDESAAQNGKWFDLPGQGRIQIARGDNRKAVHYALKLRSARSHLLTEVTVDALEAAEQIATKVIARYILLGWENVFVDGTKIEYSVEAAERILTEFPMFKNQIRSIADNAAMFRAQELIDVEKN